MWKLQARIFARSTARRIDADVIAEASKDDFDERCLQLRMDQGYGAARILARIDERTKCITRFATPGICELL